MCEKCKNEYQRWPSKVEKGSHFCSRECRKTGLSHAEYMQQYNQLNRAVLRDKLRERMQAPEKKQARSQQNKSAVKQRKMETIDAYGGCFCSCDHNGKPCGAHPIEFLAIDHINGEGKDDNRGGYRLYRWLKEQGYPLGFRVLCHNCNSSLGFYGYCPHSETETQKLWHHK